MLDFIAKANSDDLRTYIGAWLETEDCRAATAKEHGKPDKRIIKLALTDDQVAQFGKFSDDISIELAKALQRAPRLFVHLPDLVIYFNSNHSLSPPWTIHENNG